MIEQIGDKMISGIYVRGSGGRGHALILTYRVILN